MNDWSEDNFLERLTPQLRMKADGARGPCPDAETLMAVIEGAASEPEQNTVNEHLSQCAACAELRSRLLSFESASPPEPEPAWTQTETRLDNWMEGFLRSEASPSRAPQGGKPRRKVIGWESLANSFTRRMTAWRWVVAAALVLTAITPLLLEYQQELRPLVQVAVLTLIRQGRVLSGPVGVQEKGPEKQKIAPNSEGSPKPLNNVPPKAELPKAGGPGAPLAPAGPAPTDRNLPTETAEVRVPAPSPTPPSPPTLQLFPDGRVASIRTIGMTINYRFDGGRTITYEQNQRTLVGTGPHSGYIERPYHTRIGPTYYQRTYLAGGQTYTKLYRGFEYHGSRYYVYVPVRHFSPAFYVWVSNPWTAPVYYNWSWGSAPWFYGGYFAQPRITLLRRYG